MPLVAITERTSGGGAIKEQLVAAFSGRGRNSLGAGIPLPVSARMLALENAILILIIMLGGLASSVDLDPIISAALDRYEGAAERHGFAVGLSDTERGLLTDQIKQRLSVVLKPLTSFSERLDLS